MGSKPVDISGSRGAAILGLSDWSTPLDQFLEIMEARKPGFCEAHGYKPPEFEMNPALRWGLAFEDAVIWLAQKKQRTGIHHRERFYRAVGIEYVTCHIDGFYDDYRRLHEGKTTNLYTFRDTWGEPETNRVPGYIQIQVQHQMICTMLPEAIVSVLVFPRRQDELEELGFDLEDKDKRIPTEWGAVLDEMGFFHQYYLEANIELQNRMVDGYRDFWEHNVSRETPPEPKDYDDLRKLIKEPKGTIVADENIERWSKEYKDLTGEARDMGKRRDELKRLIVRYMSNNATHNIDGDSVEKWILRDMAGKKLHQFDGSRFR